MDAMVVHVEALAHAAVEDARKASATTLREYIKEVIGVTVIVNVTEPEGVARSQGKAQRIVDNRPKG